MSTEWGIQFRDDRQPDMSGRPRVMTMTVDSEATARTAMTWKHGSWPRPEQKVVRREVTEWAEPDQPEVAREAKRPTDKDGDG